MRLARTSRAAALAAVVACGEPSEDGEETPPTPTEGGGWAAEAPDAPWELGDLQTVKWASSQDVGLLMLSTDVISCDEITSAYDDGFREVSRGTGLVFVVYRDSETPNPSFEGLYLSGYGYTAGYDEGFGLGVGAFNDDIFWTLAYYSGGAWLRIDEDTSSGVSGEFFAVWWAGEFEAEDCGELETGGYDYGGSGYYY